MRCEGLRLPCCPSPPPRDWLNEMLLAPPTPAAKQAQRRAKPSSHQTRLLSSLSGHRNLPPQGLLHPAEAAGSPCCLWRLSLRLASPSAQPGFTHVRSSRNRKGIEGFGYPAFLGPLCPRLMLGSVLPSFPQTALLPTTISPSWLSHHFGCSLKYAGSGGGRELMGLL